MPISKWLRDEAEADARLAALQQQLKVLEEDDQGQPGVIIKQGKYAAVLEFTSNA